MNCKKKFFEFLSKCDDFAIMLLGLEDNKYTKEYRETITNNWMGKRFEYIYHRNIIEMELLDGEDVFPCDFIASHIICTYVDNDICCLEPIIIPSDSKVMTRLMNRILTTEQKNEYSKEIERIKQTYIDNTIDFSNHDDESDDTFSKNIIYIIRTVLAGWITPLRITYHPGIYDEFKEVWVRIEGGKLVYSDKQVPRSILLIKDITAKNRND